MIVMMSVTQWYTMAQLSTKNMPESAKTSDNPMMRSQKIMMTVMPIFFAFTGIQFQIGVLVYWVTTNLAKVQAKLGEFFRDRLRGLFAESHPHDVVDACQKIFEAHGLEVFHVEKLPTHGGSLRLYIQHAGGSRPMMNSIADVEKQEEKFGLKTLETYQRFSEKVKSLKRDLLSLLIAMKNDKKTIVAYGAAAKGNRRQIGRASCRERV